jgi:CRP/FNR family transcriptional regulator, cyclic AMP receptor protein
MAAEPPKKLLARGQVIFHENETGDEMYLICSGTVKISKNVGDKHVTLGTFGKNEFFGEMALLNEQGRSGTAIAMDDCELLVINRATFDGALNAAPGWLGAVVKSLAGRLSDMDMRIGKDLVYVGKKYPGVR